MCVCLCVCVCVCVCVSVCVCVCVSVRSHLTSGASVRPENPVTYSADNGGQIICWVFSETAWLQRSSTPPLKALRTVGHFPVESAHAYLTTRTCKRPVWKLS